MEQLPDSFDLSKYLAQLAVHVPGFDKLQPLEQSLVAYRWAPDGVDGWTLGTVVFTRALGDEVAPTPAELSAARSAWKDMTSAIRSRLSTRFDELASLDRLRRAVPFDEAETLAAWEALVERNQNGGALTRGEWQAAKRAAYGLAEYLGALKTLDRLAEARS